jgi:hypothetical protein
MAAGGVYCFCELPCFCIEDTKASTIGSDPYISLPVFCESPHVIIGEAVFEKEVALVQLEFPAFPVQYIYAFAINTDPQNIFFIGI